MKIRRFIAADMQEALARVKAVLGSDAVILQTRRFRTGGFLGLFGTGRVEVTAAVDEGTAVRPAPTTPPKRREQGDSLEIGELKALLGEVLKDLEGGTPGVYPKNFRRVYRNLTDNGVEPGVARQLMAAAMKEVAPSRWEDSQEVYRVTARLIGERLPVRPMVLQGRREKKRIALVGPTGVGKTTTIAKLAATFAILQKRRVALATVDTYRIAAVSQLKTYADIISVPLEVAYTPDELQEALRKHQDKELILIDTAGRSPLNELQMNELKAFLEPCERLEIALVLGATMKGSDLMETVRRFSRLPVQHLVFTKLDETRHYGTILNVVSKTHKTVAYVTTGQSVPDDIEVPDPGEIAKKILQVNR